MSVTVKCDICGETIPDSAFAGKNLSVTKNRSGIDATLDVIYPAAVFTNKFDICDRCANGLVNLIKSGDGKDMFCDKLRDYE